MDAGGKIFGLGLSRTGTASLIEALEQLGYRGRHFPSVSFRLGWLGRFGRGSLHLDEGELASFDAFADTPVIPFFRELDVRYPGSKFILTVRDVEAWLDSCENFPRFSPDYRPGAEAAELRRLVYGTARFDRAMFAATYERHTREVSAYFRDRPDALLIMDICGGEGWERLCAFLDRPVPAATFPRRNARPAASG